MGGQVRVKIESGEDIAHLGELDRKLWTVLSCPTKGLELDEQTLKFLDADGDGHIHVDEVISAAQWLTGSVRDKDSILRGRDSIAIREFSESEEGLKLRKSAKQILKNLGLEKESISIEDTADSTKIFEKTIFNGDGVITEASANDAPTKEVIKKIIEITGGTLDRSGQMGVNTEQVEAFYEACTAYDAWQKAASGEVFPYGENTAAALEACNAIKDKVADYFMRCKLIGFDADAAAAVDVDIEKLKEISSQNLAGSNEQIASYPLARPNAEGKLPLKGGINPAWQAAFDTLKTLVLDVDFPKKDAITEEEWNAVLGKFNAHCSWIEEKQGAEVESLGAEAVSKILKGNSKKILLSLLEQDKALEEESLGIDAVGKFLHFYRDFYTFLCNYVVFSDFYDEQKLSIFQAGKLYIDQRCCELCVRVEDMGTHADMAALSNMYLLYCLCTSKVDGSTLNIAAVLTKGSISGLREGKNAIFYDRNGLDYDAVVTKIVDNPISVLQAFWSPYRKFGRWISDKFTKKASDKEGEGFSNLTSAADKPAEAKKSAFDIAKFAGIFAAIGMALGFLAQAIVSIARGIAAAKWWVVLLVIVAILLIISLPSMFLAWYKLRHRDVGPLLNANGWAINAASYVRNKFGKHLTALAEYPKLTAVDEEAKTKARRNIFLLIICVLFILLMISYLIFGR